MRLSALDGWRGIACLLVAIYHLNVAHSLYFLPLFQNGAPILELFFVISGFVMALTFGEKIRDGRGAAAYLVRVVARLYPLHWITLAPLVLLASVKALAGAESGGFYGTMSLDALIPQLFNVQTWVGQGLTWNFPSWTLSGEMAAYLVFAVIMMTFQSRTWRVMAAVLVVIITGAVFASELTPGREQYNVISLARCFVGFFVGYLLFDVWRLRQVQTPWLATTLEVVTVTALIVSLHARFDGPAYFLNYAVIALLVHVFATGKGLLSRLVAIPPLLWLGKVSFSLYMIHAVIKTYIAEAFYAAERFTDLQFYQWFAYPLGEPVRLITLGSAWANNLMLMGYLAVVFIAAHFMFKLIELPTRTVSQQVSKQINSLPSGAFARIWETMFVRRKRV
jgi:peptidoglycan/LPS O-acetylase OafA/YrhL